MVIAKLETLLERTVSSKATHQQNTEELEKLKLEVSSLQGQVQKVMVESHTPQFLPETAKLHSEIRNLESLFRDLQDELLNRKENMNKGNNNLNNVTANFNGGGGGYTEAQGLGDYEDWDEEKVAMEIDKQRAEARVIAI